MAIRTRRFDRTCGHAIARQDELLAPDRPITRGNRLVESSGVIGTFGSEDEAQSAGLEWALAWVDQHG
ncbi:hypothetical protein [Burkholderia sp. Ax-1719]|uniref:hypothetical protein n=1 Tax=Burkholderia sp. Ax-1719 TaxID=2608334 RepID=UPI001421944B|nr:hypothetical protein [Burkholderia sp. Ax-1719]